MEALQLKLSYRDILFSVSDHCVMCFGHVVDLSSERIIQHVDPKASKASDDIDGGCDDAATSNPITLAHFMVRAIWASGMRRDAFDDVIKNGNKKGWFQQGQPLKPVQVQHQQLLHDVQTRWDSVYYMLERLHTMCPVRLNVLLNACWTTTWIDLSGYRLLPRSP